MGRGWGAGEEGCSVSRGESTGLSILTSLQASASLTGRCLEPLYVQTNVQTCTVHTGTYGHMHRHTQIAPVYTHTHTHYTQRHMTSPMGPHAPPSPSPRSSLISDPLVTCLICAHCQDRCKLFLLPFHGRRSLFQPGGAVPGFSLAGS